MLLSEKSLILSANHYGFPSHTIISGLRNNVECRWKIKRKSRTTNDKHTANKKKNIYINGKYAGKQIFVTVSRTTIRLYIRKHQNVQISKINVSHHAPQSHSSTSHEKRDSVASCIDSNREIVNLYSWKILQTIRKF